MWQLQIFTNKTRLIYKLWHCAVDETFPRYIKYFKCFLTPQALTLWNAAYMSKDIPIIQFLWKGPFCPWSTLTLKVLCVKYFGHRLPTQSVFFFDGPGTRLQILQPAPLSASSHDHLLMRSFHLKKTSNTNTSTIIDPNDQEDYSVSLPAALPEFDTM